MLTGKELGAAIASAIEKKKEATGLTKKRLAELFEIKPPSVSDWCKRGTISKDKLQDLMEFFSDVVGPEHWGLKSPPLSSTPESAPIIGTIRAATDQRTQQVIDLMRATDDEGRAMALAAVKVALAGHMPAKAKRRK